MDGACSGCGGSGGGCEKASPVSSARTRLQMDVDHQRSRVGMSVSQRAA